MSVTIALLTAGGSPAAQSPGASGETTQLTTSAETQTDPAISGNIAVWWDQRNGNDDIYYCDVRNCPATEVQVTSATTNQRFADVSGNIIVYTDLTSPGPSVRAFDIAANADLGVIGPVGSISPRINGSLVVYEVGLAGATDIWLTDLSTCPTRCVFTQITSSSTQDLNAVVQGRYVVFERHQNSAMPGDIVLFDRTTGSESVISGVGDDHRPDIDGHMVVYDTVAPGGDEDVVLYDMATAATTPIVQPGRQRLAHVSGDFMSFDDEAFGNQDVWLYHIPTGTFHAVENSPASAFLNDLDGNRLVYVSRQAGNFDIWAYTFEDQEIDVAPTIYDFGDVAVGSSATTILTISNTGHAPLVVSAVAFQSGSSPAFTATLGSPPPIVVAGGATFDVNVSYAPAVGDVATSTLSIASNDFDEPIVQVALRGNGSARSPSQMVADVLAFFDQSVADGTLTGAGAGSSAQGRRNALRNMVAAAGDLIRAGRITDACEQLRNAYLRTDGAPKPPDFVAGSAAVELAARIQSLRATLGCP